MIKNGMNERDALDKLGIEIGCCRQAFLSHTDYMEDLY